jgi:diguanylate cyclase (GGDEF)-like protein
LTRLPGNLAIEAEIRRRIEGREPFAVLYEDLDNFKAFNDAYGFTHGDEAIVLLASTTVDVAHRRGTTRDFVGHIGGDDFIIVTMPDRAEEIAREIIDDFDRAIRKLYNDRDLRQGYIETRDRRGTLNRFPIMSLSIAIISSDQRELTNYAQVGEAAAELKRFAKSIGGSVFVKDKRRK